MNQFSKELRIISTIAWTIAILVAVCSFFGIYLLLIPHGQHARFWPPTGQVMFSIWPALLLFIFVALIGYVNADARRRGMRHVMWTLLAIFVPNSIGIILYFVLRDPLLVRCPQCGTPGRSNFLFCPQCGGELSPVCFSCRRSMEPGWKKCAYCGADAIAGLPAAELQPKPGA